MRWVIILEAGGYVSGTPPVINANVVEERDVFAKEFLVVRAAGTEYECDVSL
jgi:hypothetical protein